MTTLHPASWRPSSTGNCPIHKIIFHLFIYLPNSWYVCVVPSVVVNKNSSISHCCDLVAIIPPRHDLGILRGVLSKPVVGLAKVVKDDSRAVVLIGSQHNGGGGVSLGGHLEDRTACFWPLTFRGEVYEIQRYILCSELVKRCPGSLHNKNIKDAPVDLPNSKLGIFNIYQSLRIYTHSRGWSLNRIDRYTVYKLVPQCKSSPKCSGRCR